MATVTAKPAKLDDGSWGAVTNGSSNVKAGDNITVKTRNGETMERVVAEVVDRNHEGGVLVAVKNARNGQEKKGKQGQRKQQDQVTVQTCGDLRAIRPLTEGQPSTEFALQADSSPQT